MRAVVGGKIKAKTSAIRSSQPVFNECLMLEIPDTALGDAELKIELKSKSSKTTLCEAVLSTIDQLPKESVVEHTLSLSQTIKKNKKTVLYS